MDYATDKRASYMTLRGTKDRSLDVKMQKLRINLVLSLVGLFEGMSPGSPESMKMFNAFSRGSCAWVCKQVEKWQVDPKEDIEKLVLSEDEGEIHADKATQNSGLHGTRLRYASLRFFQALLELRL